MSDKQKNTPGVATPAAAVETVAAPEPSLVRIFDPAKAIANGKTRTAARLAARRVTPSEKSPSNAVHVQHPALTPTPPNLTQNFPISDLSQEQLLRNTPRVPFRGQLCPSLNGIPLIAKLGQGGQGAVYCGIHPRLQNKVAVKVLPLYLATADAGLVQRLIREAQIAAMIQSPHLATVYDVNQEEGQFFIVMEFVTGVTVGQHLKQLAKENQRGMKELDAIDVCIAACIGLDAAHQEGVIHRDLKPENIMIPFRSRQQNLPDLRRAKLMDLGMARSENARSDNGQPLTGLKVAMGTPGYMSPEQIMDATTASKPSDVYGMGATLYAMLTGRPPYKEHDGDEMMRLIFATVNDVLVPVSKRRKDVSKALDKVVSKCLEKKPENRYQDARELVRALASVRRGLTSTGGTFDLFDGRNDAARSGVVSNDDAQDMLQAVDAMSMRASKKKRRRREGLAVAAFAVVVVAAAGYTLYPRGYTPAQRSAIVELHGDRIRTVYNYIRSDRSRAIEMLKIAQDETSKYSGISELIQKDKTAGLFIQVEDELMKPGLQLDDYKVLGDKVGSAVVATDEEKTEAAQLKMRIDGKMKRIQQKEQFEGAFTAFEKAYNDVLIDLNEGKFQEAATAKRDADSAYQAVRAIDPDFKPGFQFESIQQRIDDDVKYAAYRAALAETRDVLNRGNADAAEKKLDEAVRIKPVEEMGSEDAEIKQLIYHAEYSNALAQAQKLKGDARFDEALRLLEIASMKKPLDEPSASLVALRRDILEAKGRAGVDTALRLALALKAEGKRVEALARIDDARDAAMPVKAGVDFTKLDALEKEIVAAQREDSRAAAAAEKTWSEKGKGDDALAQRITAAKQRVQDALEKGKQLVADQKYDEAIQLYNSVAAEALKFKLSEVSAWETAMAFATKAKQENSVEGKKRRQIDELLAATANVPDSGIDAALDQLDVKTGGVEDPALASRKLMLGWRKAALAARTAEAKNASSRTTAFNQAMTLFKSELYDQAIDTLNTNGFPRTAAAFDELKKMITSARADAGIYERSYSGKGGLKNEISTHDAELDKKFTAALKRMTGLNAAAQSNLENVGLNGMSAVVDKTHQEYVAASQALEAVWADVRAKHKAIREADKKAAPAAPEKVRPGDTESAR